VRKGKEMSVNLQKAAFVLSAAGAADFPRDRLPQIAFAGRSNVGKSSVINRLLNRKNFARVGAAPGKTTHINYFLIDEQFYLVDLPGYGYAKVSQAEKARWGKLMEQWFADNTLMTLGIMIVDARHKPTADDCTMAEWFKGSGRPFAVVANKLDKLKKSETEPNLARIRETLELPSSVKVIPFSAEKGDGKQELLNLILEHAGEFI
jgi:GTP-binding protein